MARPPAKVGLFVTCLVDLFRPSVGWAAVELLAAAGCAVDVPRLQTCCGQPAYNSGARDHAKAIARQVISAFQPFDYVVAPSGSCAAMIKHHYPTLFDDGDPARAGADALAAKTHELVSFLSDLRGILKVDADFHGTVTYHDACSGLRELGVKHQPRVILDNMPGVQRRELKDAEVCCGFGGTFCVKYPEISGHMVDDKATAIEASGAELLLAGDLGCLMNIAGKLKRRGAAVKVRHVAEVLAGRLETPAIGEAAREPRR